MFFSYTQAETEYLKSRDKKLAAIIDRVGFIERKTEKDVFSELVLSVLGQQISNKAFETVKRRFTDAIGDINAENILHMGIDGIRGCGVSGRKAENICAIAESVLSGGFDPSELVSLSDDEVIKRLYELKKPFAILLPLNSLQGISRYEYFKHGIQLLTFDKRIAFHSQGNMEKFKRGSSFATAYFCKDVLPKDLIIEELKEYERPLIREEREECTT